MEKGLSVVIDSVESKMIRYKKHEIRLRSLYRVCFNLVVALMLIGLAYPVIFLIFREYYSVKWLGYYLGYIPIVMSICTFLYLQMFFPKERIISVTLLNNRISSLFDDHAIDLISTERLKSNVEQLIEEYVMTRGNLFFVRDNY